MRFLGLLAVAVVVTACSDPGFEGTFEGTYESQPVTLVLKREGTGIRGTIRWHGVEAQVKGSVEGTVATGTVRHPEMGFEGPFEATLTDDAVQWVFLFKSQLGEVNRLPLTLFRK